MDKGLANESDGGSSSNRGDVFLKHLNKNSHRIAKPVRKPLPPPHTAAGSSGGGIMDPNLQNPGPQSQQPPVYNINKNDFRDVVQKLTGSPANERNPAPSPPPPQPQTRGQSSRLQRIRPPPLSQIYSRPPLNELISTEAQGQRMGQQHMLPPLPSVHIPAESPISAYMRFLKNSNSLPAPSPLWSGGGGPRPDFGQRPPRGLTLPPLDSAISAYLRSLNPNPSSVNAEGQPSTQSSDAIPLQQPLQSTSAPPASFPPFPLSPLPFGCAPSPRSPYGMGQSFLLSPTAHLGLPPLPLSPVPSLPSPRLKGI